MDFLKRNVGIEKVPSVLGTPGGQSSGLRMSPLHMTPPGVTLSVGKSTYSHESLPKMKALD
jgi:hypothetical protein